MVENVFLVSHLLCDRVFILNTEGLVSTLSVNFFQMSHSLVLNNLANVLHVAILWAFHNRLGYLWILSKYFLSEELLWKIDSFNSSHGQVDEFRFLVKANVVVTNDRTCVALNGNIELILWKTLSHHVVPNANLSLLDEIEICNFVLFIEYELLVIQTFELSRLESKADIIEELRVLVLGCQKEETMFENHIIIKIV